MNGTGFVSYTCKVCHRSFDNPLDFVKHKAQSHGRMESSNSGPRTDPSLLQVKDEELRSEAKLEHDFEFDTIDTSSLFKIEPVILNEWESNFGEEIRDILYTLKTMEDYPAKKKKPNKSKVVRCDKCDKLFSSKYTLKTHLKIHDGEKPFQCELCGKNFSQKINLKYHMRTHTGEKPHVCSFCEKGFAQIANLATHIRRLHTKTLKGMKTSNSTPSPSSTLQSCET